MIAFDSLGKVSVTAPGTVARVSSVPLLVHGIRVEAVPGATGRVYLGVPGLNRTTRAGVIATLAAPAAGVNAVVDSFTFDAGDVGSDVLDLSQFVIDADVAGEGPVVSYWKA